MDANIVQTLLENYGPAGLFIAYLIWEKRRTAEVEEKRITAQEKLAESLGCLAELIRGIK
jgi:hypothetical protein